MQLTGWSSDDMASIDDLLQAGAQELVTAQHCTKPDIALSLRGTKQRPLTGDTNTIALIPALTREESSRGAAGRKDCMTPFSLNLGQNILNFHSRTTLTGYPAIDGLNGRAVLRGNVTALSLPASGPLL